jgi:hypothetical protein
MNTNENLKFELKVKKERIYSERIVELSKTTLFYFEKEKPKEIRFQANLVDIVYFEKYKNEKSKYKVSLTSKTNSFPQINLRSADVNALQNFKMQLEKYINDAKLKKNKKEVIMRFTREEKGGVSHFEDQYNSSNINQNKIINHHSSSNQLMNKNFQSNFKQLPKETSQKLYDSLENHQLDTKRYNQILKFAYKIFKHEDEYLTTQMILIYSPGKSTL